MEEESQKEEEQKKLEEDKYNEMNQKKNDKTEESEEDKNSVKSNQEEEDYLEKELDKGPRNRGHTVAMGPGKDNIRNLLESKDYFRRYSIKLAEKNSIYN